MSEKPQLQEKRTEYDSRSLVPVPSNILRDAQEASGKPQPTITMDFIDEPWLGKRAIVLHDVLSQPECDALIRYGEAHNNYEAAAKEAEANNQDVREATKDVHGMIPAGSRNDYRNNLRLICESAELSDIISSRICPFLKDLEEDVVTVTEENNEDFLDNGLGMLGKWRLSSLNTCFRLCKYNPGGHFAPHYDGDYMSDVDHRSFKTFMIYLNDDYEDGETNFLSEHQLHFDTERKLYCANPQNIMKGLKARRGDALIFDHKILHEGAQVRNGCKYIIRTDTMYRRCREDSSNLDEETKQKQRDYDEAVMWVQKAKQSEGNGEMDEAIKYYKKAFKLCPELERLM